MAALPAVTPVTTPVDPTVAVAVLLLLHVPGVVASVRLVVAPFAHTLNVPVMPEGRALTDTLAVILQPVGIV